MKKLFMLAMMVMMLAISAVASAASGKTIDAEEAAAEKFFNGGTYKAAMSVMGAEMIGNWDETSYNNMKAAVTRDFGKITVNRLRVIEKLDDADVLRYQIVGEKMPVAMFVYVFKNDTGRPLLQNFIIQVPQPQQEEAAAEQK